MRSRWLDPFFPPHCHACQAHLEFFSKDFLCFRCTETVLVLEEHCFVCGQFVQPICPELEQSKQNSKSQNDLLCSRCRHQSSSIRRVIPLYAYTGAMREMLHSWKYQSDRVSGVALQALFAHGAKKNLESLGSYDWSAPVPLFAKRLRARGFNQSWSLLSAVSQLQLADKSLPHLLERKQPTKSQVGLSRQERISNLHEAFGLSKAYQKEARGKRILLVDDVVTTGSTAESCAQALLDWGAHSVDMLALCRAIG